MASYEKLHDSELEAGRTMDHDNDVVVDEKGQGEESTSLEDSNRRAMSPLKRAFAVVFIFAFIGFSLLRGVALVSVHCISSSSRHSQLGNQPELMEDEAFMEALRSISPEEYCKLYAEYCPDKTEPAMDTWEKVEAIDDISIDLSDAEPAIKASLDKRQDTGNNGTVSQPPSTSISTVSEPTTSSSTSTAGDDDDTSTSQLPPPPAPVTTSTTEAPVPPSTTSTSTSTSTEDDDDETSTTSQGSTSQPTTTSEVVSTSTTSERSSSDEDETSSTPITSSSRRIVTSGTITTSSAERRTFTSTLPDGGATTITSTSWVEFVPEETAQSENDPNLQGSASGWQRSTYLQVVMGVLVGGLLLV